MASNADVERESHPAAAGTVSTDRILDVLERQSCRALLQTLDATPQTVNEIDDECALPISSIYRCLHELVDAGLVTESTRLREKGRHPNQYALEVGEVVIDLEETSGPQVELRTGTLDGP